MMKLISYKKVPYALRIIDFLKNFLIVLPIVILFYKDKGLTVGDFFLIQGIFAFAKFILEIPTGYIGDLFSRKKVISLATFFYALGYVIWHLYDGFFFILLGELLFGVSFALYSGTGEAYLYDILKKQNREKKIVKELGKIKSISALGTTIATFTGATLYKLYGADGVTITTLSLLIIAFLISLALPELEDVKRQVEEGKSKVQDILDIAKYAINHSEIKWLMLFPAIYGSITLTIMWCQQPFMENNGVAVYLFGLFIGLNMFWRTVFAYKANYLFNKFKTNNFSLGLFAILTIGIFTCIMIPDATNIYVTYFLLIIIGIAAASQACLSVVMNSMINHRIKSDERATVLSVSAMIGSIISGLMMILLKFLVDYIGMQMTFVVIVFIALIPCFIALKKLLKLEL